MIFNSAGGAREDRALTKGTISKELQTREAKTFVFRKKTLSLLLTFSGKGSPILKARL